MVLSIKSDEADRLARELAAETGESLTEAVLVALRQRLHSERRRPRMSQRLHRLQCDVQELPVVDSRTAEEIISYDRDGLPG